MANRVVLEVVGDTGAEVVPKLVASVYVTGNWLEYMLMFVRSWKGEFLIVDCKCCGAGDELAVARSLVVELAGGGRKVEAKSSMEACDDPEQTAGLHSAMQLLTTALKKTMSEPGNLKASNGAKRRWPAGSIFISGPMMFESVGQPSESINCTELA